MPSRRVYRKWNDPPLLVCEHCNEGFYPFLRDYGGKNHGFYYEQRFCSRACANMARPKKIWLDKHGYPQMRTEDGRNVAVHRQVMEKKLGRKLLPSETVHHKDGNRQNYDEANLELWSTRHGRGQRVADLYHISASNLICGALSLGG